MGNQIVFNAETALNNTGLIGLCINVWESKYIYTMGEETGYVVKLINYPRFPKDDAEILHHAFTLANLLLDNTYQGSYTVLTPNQTYFVSKREGDKNDKTYHLL